MLSNVLRTGAASAFLLAIGAIVLAQQPVVVPAQPPVRVEAQAQPAQAAVASATYRAKQILGSKIMIQNNTAIGTVDDMVFDSAGNLEYLVVANEGKLITVPWDAAKWDLKNQTATLPITQEVYKTIPTYTATAYPDYWAPAYRTQVYKYYNLTPRELRILNRRLP